MYIPRLKFAGFAVVRSPLLAATDFAVLEPTTAADLESRILQLEELARRTPVSEALTTASPALRAALDAPPSRPGGRTSIALATMRYVERMRGRATPFGLCAGYTIVPAGGDAAGSVSIQLLPRARYTAVLRVDVDMVSSAIRDHLAADADARARAEWVPSREVMLLGDTAKIYRRAAGGDVSFADVVRSEALEQILALPDEGASFADIVASLAAFDDDREVREAYVGQLIDVGILVARAAPSVATDDELAGLDALGDAPLGGRTARSLAEKARAYRHGPIGPELLGAAREIESAFARYATKAQAAEAPKEAEGEGDDAEPGKARACIYDLLKDVESGGLDSGFLWEVSRLVAVLRRVSLPREDERHRKFREYLRERYESREVPLAEALDPEYGFDFPVTPEYAPKVSPLEDWRLRLFANALARGEREIILGEGDLPDEPPPASPPAGFALHCRVACTAAGWSIHEPRLVPAPGTLYFGRATGLSTDLRDRVRGFIEAQSAQMPDVDVAQLTYFVPGRSASFVQFPTLTPFEITLSARPGLSAERRLGVNDIVVGVSGQRTVLRSRKTGREIALRPTGAANVNRAGVSPIARFLSTRAELPYASGFDWGALSGAPYLPRVRFEAHVLASARWNLAASQTRPLREAKTVAARFEAVQTLRKELHWPRHVLFAERADHLLPIDLDDVLSVEAWLDILGERAQIREQFPAEESAIVGPEGPYHHELVVPLLSEAKRAEAKKPALRPPPHMFDEAASFDRVPPGDRCLFLSIYGARADLLSVLVQTLRELVTEARSERAITHWFYLPYADPDPHLRLRFFGDPKVLFGDLLLRIRETLAPLLQSRVIRRIRVDTYERETVRYGGARTMDLCERVFCASSEAALRFHDAFEGDETRIDDVLPPVVQSLRAMLLLSGLAPAEARAQAARAGESYTRAADRAVPKRAAGAFLREHRARLSMAGTPEDLLGPELAEQFRRALADVRASCAEEGASFERIVADLMHVHTIRLLTVWCPIPNLEATAYFTLEKILAGEIARARPSAASETALASSECLTDRRL